VFIRHVTVGLFEENSYLVADEASGDAVLIDPGDDGDVVLRMVEESGFTPRAIWLTHAHIDHIAGIVPVKKRFDIPIYLHPADQPVYDAQSFFAESYGINFEPPPPPDHQLAEGDILTLGEHRFSVRHTPGHAPGHVIFHSGDIVFSGDLLFAGSVGRTDLPLASPADMVMSLQTIAALPAQTLVFAGHGPSTTIGAELRSNPFLNGTAYVKRDAY